MPPRRGLLMLWTDKLQICRAYGVPRFFRGEFWRDGKMDRRDAGSTWFAMSLIVCIIYVD